MISGGLNGSWILLGLLALASILIIGGIILSGGTALVLGGVLTSVGAHLEIISFYLITRDYTSEDWATFASCFLAVFFAGMGTWAGLGPWWGTFFDLSGIGLGTGCFSSIFS